MSYKGSFSTTVVRVERSQGSRLPRSSPKEEGVDEQLRRRLAARTVVSVRATDFL